MTILMPGKTAGIGRKLFISRALELSVPWWSFDGSLDLIESSCSQNAFCYGKAPDIVREAAIEVRSKRAVLRRTAGDGTDLLAFPYPDGVVVVDLSEVSSFRFSEQMARILDNYYSDLNCIAEDQRATEGRSEE